ncbi:hypothetical protein ABZP36_004269 [Zizania latifolia]
MTIGRENLPLHNHLIRSILRNACQANGPPAINAPKLTGDVTNSEHTLPPVWNNGNVLNEHVNDNRPLSRRDSALTRHSSLNLGETIIRENGTPKLSDLKRRTQFQHNEHAEPITKRSHMEKVPLIFHEPPHINGPSAIAHGENLRDEIIHHIRGPVQAPLGIHFGPISFGGTQKPSTIASAPSNDSSVSCYELCELCDTMSLRKRMEKIAEAEGLEGVSIECANLLNNGVDVFLKQLIGSCVQLVGTRSQHGKLSHMSLKQELRRQPFRVSKDVLIYWSLIPDRLRGHNMEFSLRAVKFFLGALWFVASLFIAPLLQPKIAKHSFKLPGFHADEQMMSISKWVTSMTEQMFSANNMRTLFFKTCDKTLDPIEYHYHPTSGA